MSVTLKHVNVSCKIHMTMTHATHILDNEYLYGHPYESNYKLKKNNL